MHPLIAILSIVGAVVGLGDPDVEAALRGEIPVHTQTSTTAAGKTAGGGIGAIVVERPMQTVWATVTRYEDKAEYTPRLKKVEVLEKRPELQRVRMEVDAAVITARYTGLFQIDEREHRIHWTLDRSAPDNTVADIDGEYRLFQVSPERTLVVYRTWVDSGRAVPRFIQEYMTRKSIPNLLKALKMRVESGGQWRK